MTDRAAAKAVTYWDYIQLEQLLSLQSGLERDEAQLCQDEVVFITVHQVYELWFKLVLRDLGAARDLFARPHVPDDALAGARRLLDRIRIAMDMGTQHFQLVETITSRDFLSFRDKLFPANGGQSPQFREVEILMGLDEADRIPYVTGGSYREVLNEPDGSPSFAAERVAARLSDRPTLKDAVDEWLYRTPIHGVRADAPGADAAVSAFLDGYLETHAKSLTELSERVTTMAPSEQQRQAIRKRYDHEIGQAREFFGATDIADERARPRRRRIRAAILFINIYRELPLLAWPREILDGLLAVEHAFVTYRQRHARMAERVIGRRVGTGGSSGVEYLDQSALSYRVFRDLWGVQTLLVPRERVPDPVNPAFYGFNFETGSKADHR